MAAAVSHRRWQHLQLNHFWRTLTLCLCLLTRTRIENESRVTRMHRMHRENGSKSRSGDYNVSASRVRCRECRLARFVSRCRANFQPEAQTFERYSISNPHFCYPYPIGGFTFDDVAILRRAKSPQWQLVLKRLPSQLPTCQMVS
jgi:hypothetical protein